MDFQSAMETFAEAWVAANSRSSLNALNCHDHTMSLIREGRPIFDVETKSLPFENNNVVSSTKRECGGASLGGTKSGGQTPPPVATNTTTAAASLTHHASCADGVVSSDDQPLQLTIRSMSSSICTGSPGEPVAPNDSDTPSGANADALPAPSFHADKLVAVNRSAGGDAIFNATIASDVLKHNDTITSCSDLTTNHGKSLPVHCVVETIYSLDEANCSGTWLRRPRIEKDSYVIIPVTTTVNDLVQEALRRLGYPMHCSQSAKGSVVIKNWKPLSFHKIADGPSITVGDILGELTTIATLKIQLFRTRVSSLMEIRDKLLRLLLKKSQHLLNTTGCPLDENTLMQLCGSHNLNHYLDINETVREKFEDWWESQIAQANVELNHALVDACAAPQFVPYRAAPITERTVSLYDDSLKVHPALQNLHAQYPAHKARMRTSFDPELELPKLQSWFAENQHPTRQQIQLYVKQLNGLESRRGRKPLDINNVVYWFKNARAAQKRAENRAMPPLRMHFDASARINEQMPKIKQNETGVDAKKSEYPNAEEMFAPTSQRSAYSIDSDTDDDALSDEDDEEPESVNFSPTSPLSLTTTTDNERYRNERDERDERAISHSPVVSTKMEVGKVDGADEEKASYMEERTHVATESGDMYDAMKRDATKEPSAIMGVDNGVMSSQQRFQMVSNSMLEQSIMYMRHHYLPSYKRTMQMSPPSSNYSLSSSDERRKRNRTFIDPVTEVPRLEQWFASSTHPSHNLILKYTDELNQMPYRHKFPRLEAKNIQFWFKNRRAKCKRLKMALYDTQSAPRVAAHSFYNMQ